LKYAAACLSASVCSPVCSRCTWTSNATSLSTSITEGAMIVCPVRSGSSRTLLCAHA